MPFTTLPLRFWITVDFAFCMPALPFSFPFGSFRSYPCTPFPFPFRYVYRAGDRYVVGHAVGDSVRSSLVLPLLFVRLLFRCVRVQVVRFVRFAFVTFVLLRFVPPFTVHVPALRLFCLFVRSDLRLFTFQFIFD